jgi:prepilin-type N-terminal cleavage/methylation domain-containing protein
VEIRPPGFTEPVTTDLTRGGNLRPRTAGDRTDRAPGFTLIELLVVIGVIALLIAMLMPVLSKARRSAHRVSCLSNLRQVTMAFHLYAGDNRQRFPDPAAASQTWESLLRPYLATREVYHCLSDGGLYENLRTSYDWRDTPDPLTTAAGKPVVEVRRSDTVLAFDALPDWHGKGRINAALIDGSATTMEYPKCLQDLDTPINPLFQSP